MKKLLSIPSAFAILRARFRQILLLDALLATLSVIALPGLAILLIDAIFILPQSFRQITLWLLTGMACLFFLFRIFSLFKISRIQLARLFENHDSKLGSALTNSVQLARQPATGVVNELLRQQAVDYGADKIQKVKVWPILKPQIYRTTIFTLLILFCWLGGYLFFSSFFQTVLPRFYDPAGDHPPFSRLQIEVGIEKDEILYGGACEILAITKGSPVDKLFLISQTKSSHNETVMFRRPDGSYFFTLSSLRVPTTFWITDGRARSKRFELKILATPIITNISVVTTFPKYTGLPPQTSSLANLKKKLPSNSSLQFQVSSNRPLKGGFLELTPLLGGESQKIALTPIAEHQTRVSGEFTLERATAFSVNVIDVDGRVSQNSAKGKVTIQPDHPPRIFIEEPGIQALATPDITIPIRVRAEDDYGISAVRLFRGYNQSIEYPANMKHEPLNHSSGVMAEGSFNFKDLGVQPGDLINYYLETIDNNPTDPGLTLSRIFTIRIISEKEYKKIIKTMKLKKSLFEGFFRLGDHLRRLIDQAETLLQKQKQATIPDLCKENERFQETMGEYEQALQEMFKKKARTEIESNFRSELYTNKIAFDLMKNNFEQMITKAQPACTLDTGEMAELLAGLKVIQGEVKEKIIQPAKQIATVVNLLAQADKFSRLAKAQAELTKLSKRFKKMTGKPSRLEQLEMRELKARQDKLRLKLVQMTQKLPKLIADLPTDEKFQKLKSSTTKFLNAVHKLEIQNDLNAAVEKWLYLQGGEAYVFSKSAAEKMEKLLSQSPLSNLGSIATECLKFLPCMGSRPGDSLKQLLNAMKGDMRGAYSENGYGLYDENVGLYGPDVQIPGLTGEDAAGNRSSKGITNIELTSDEQEDPLLKQGNREPDEVSLSSEVEFPLRYRQLVGDYFKAIAESVEMEMEKE